MHKASETSFPRLNLNIVKLFLEKGTDIKVKNNKDETPFDIAKKQSNKKLINLLQNRFIPFLQNPSLFVRA